MDNDRDKNNSYFTSRVNTRETLRKYDSLKHKDKPRSGPSAFDRSEPKRDRGRDTGPTRLPARAQHLQDYDRRDDSDERYGAGPRSRVSRDHPTQPPPGKRKRRRSRGSKLPNFGALLAFLALRGKMLAAAAVVCIVAVGAAVLGFWMLGRDNSLEVFVDGQSVGFISERDTTAEELVTQVATAISVTVGTNVQIDQTITVEPTRAPSSDDIVARPDIMPEILRQVTYLAEGFVIRVNGNTIGALRTQEAADGLLDNIIRQNVPPGAELVQPASFAEDVVIERLFMNDEDFESQEVLASRLNQERQGTQTYTVQSGDALSMIATQFGMTLEEILAANPSIPPANPGISPGQSINVMYTAPMLSVQTVELSVTIEDAPYDTQTIENVTRLSTFRNVIQPGRVGQREVTAHITRLNGNITNVEVINENILEPPSNEIVEVGTR